MQADSMSVETARTAPTFKEFALQPDHTEAMKRAIAYVRSLGTMTSIDPTHWPAEVFFKPGEDAVTVNELNRRFFEQNEIRTNQAKIQAKMDEAKRIEINRGIQEQINTRILRARSRYDEYRKDAQYSYETYLDRLKHATKFRIELEVLEGRQFDVQKVVESISANAFWRYVGAEKSKVSFNTATDVVVKHVNSLAGLDITVNFGKFRADLDFLENTLTVHSIEGGTGISGHYHPHLNEGGGICWGNASSTANKKMLELQYADVFHLLASVLVNYNPENPYQPIEKWDLVVNKGHSPNDFCRVCDNEIEDCDCSHCALCERYEDDCSCYYCEVCDERVRHRGECGCCDDCNNTEGNCECCVVCSTATDVGCECCQSCETRDPERCEKCGDCSCEECGCVTKEDSKANETADDLPF